MSAHGRSDAFVPASGRRWSLSARILAGLALGVATGLFFGEPSALLQPVADVYIRLMQMTVLPYLVLTLVAGLGQLDVAAARRLGVRGGLLLMGLIGLTLAVIGLAALAFPRFESASFFSQAMVEPRQPFGLAELYFPENPFNALANAVVPGVVLFSAALGIALIGIDGKESVLQNLRVVERAVVRVTHFVFGLTPIGVFAITAVAAGTLEPATIARLEAYLLAFGVVALLVTFVVLPLIITALTPLRYRDVVSATRDALLTAFITGSAFIVLPLLMERTVALLRDRGLGGEHTDSTIKVLVPVAFTFPNPGRLLTLLFVPFAAWLGGEPLSGGAYATLFAAGVPAFFAKAQVALPFLMDLLAVPHSYFQLYIPSAVVTGRFDAMASAMSLFALATLCAVVDHDAWRRQLPQLAGRTLVAAAAVAAALAGLHAVLAATLDTRYRSDRLLTGQATRSPVRVVVRETGPEPAAAGEGMGLDRIVRRGHLRVGFVRDQPPFSFLNLRGDLVGMDVELAGTMAYDLGLDTVEFVPARRQELTALLESGRVDVVMSVPYLPALLPRLHLVGPVFEGVIGLVTPGDRRHDFARMDELRHAGRLRIGVAADRTGFEERFRAQLPDVEVEFVPLESPQDYFNGRAPHLDAVAMLAQAGAAWTLLHPQFAVTVPQPQPMKVPVGIAVRRQDAELAAFVERWLVLQRATGVTDDAYDYWILGKGMEPRQRRWSILRDVLGWGRANAR